MRTRSVWIMLATMLAVVVWATLPPDRVSLGKTCEPATLRARASRLIYGDVFWRAQLNALTAERDRLLTRMAHPEEDESSPAIESRMMRLTNEAGHGSDAESEEQQSDEARSRRQQRIALLMACQMEIEARLGR